jgi:hypothetical protein
MRMKIRHIGLVALLGACRSEQPAQRVPPGTDSAKIVARVTAGQGAEADSLLDATKEDSPDPMFTSRGDTLSDFDAVIIAADTSGTYALDVYSLNGVRYARIKRDVGRTADGYPIWSTRARSTFPVTNSPQAVVRGCRVADREDPFIFGIARIYAEVPDWHPTRTWKFDRGNETLREVPPTGTICSRMLREE